MYTVKNLWNVEDGYLGVELTPEEAALISIILTNVMHIDRSKFLSAEGEKQYQKLNIDFKA